MKWTRAQAQTIETRDHNILVSAAAGSGKTTVLIERIKQLVLRDRVNIDRFLITTFTNAAAAEMKEKMERAIRQEMEEQRKAGGDLTYLQHQMELLPSASISTFHTFALGIIRDYFYLTDLQPGFAIGDETRLSIMRGEALDQVFERRFAEDTDRLRPFLRRYSGDRNDNRLKEQILKIYGEMRSIPRYMDWAEERTDLLRREDPLHALGIDSFLLEETADALKDAARRYGAAAEILHREETGSLYLKARQDLEKIEELAGLAGAAEPAEAEEVLLQLMEELQSLKFNRMSAAKDEKPCFDDVKDEVGDLRKQGKKFIDDLKKKYYSRPPQEYGQALKAGAEDTAYFIELVREFEEVYRAAKQDRNMVDFDDCMHYCIEILENESAAADYRDRFHYIFIDEYQDSNLLQEEIVRRIARENNLFMVGDVKQSIYKFRLAEPEIFRDRYETYRGGADPHSMKIDLNSNFRSRRTIREAVNCIFEEIMDGYDEDARLNGPEGEEETGGFPVSLHIMSAAGPEEEEAGAGQDPDEAEDPSADLAEMQMIAQIIRDSVGRTITGRDGQERQITYGDIAVLSRGTAAIPRIERFLRNEDIPAFGETEGGYYETVEIQVFLNLLQVISNSSRDVPLISAMSSVVFDFSARELAQIRIEYREGSFSQAVRSYEAGGSDAVIREKIRSMRGQIELWKEIGRTVPLDELMRRLLYETGYYDYCSGLPTGEQRISNLRLLLEKAAAYEESSHLGLYGFLEYVEAMRRTRQNVSEANLIGEGRSVVHVMTVHKSKGLEFPVVILAGAGKKIRGSSEGRSPVMHKAFAIGLPEVNRDMHWERKTILQKAIAARKTRESLEEEIRILYVALTRPMERLAIVASVKDAAKLQRFTGRGSFLEMIYPAFCRMQEEDPQLAEVQVHYPGEQILQRQAPAEGESAGEDRAGGEAAEHGGASWESAGAGGLASGDAPEHGGAKESRIDPAELDRRLGFVYPRANDQLIKTKYSVTELSKKQSGKTEQLPERLPELRRMEEIIAAGKAAADAAGPDAAGGKTLSRAEIGTAMHTVMERIDFAKALEGGISYITEETRRLQEAGILTEEEAAGIQPENIDAFFRTPLGERAAKAPKLFREKEFLLRKEIEGSPVIVQGIIDCYFEDEDGLVLIDYKNSRADAAVEEEVLIERYSGQIRLYREALEEALGRPVTESWLYLFRSRKFVAVE